MLIFLLAACGGPASTPATTPSTTQQFRADVWADNWFAMYIGDRLVAEDSVPIITERSFNAES